MLEKFGMFMDSDGSIKTIFRDSEGDYLDILFISREEDSIVVPFFKDTISFKRYDVDTLVEAIERSIYSSNRNILKVYYRGAYDSLYYKLFDRFIESGNFGYNEIRFSSVESQFENNIENDRVEHLLHFRCETEEEKREFEEWVRKYRIIEKQRQDYLSWDEYFMAIAKLSAMRSKDPSTQVGACIVSSDNRLLSIGYNGAPNGYKDYKFPWDREGGNLDTKYFFVVHAERNAILNYRGSRMDFEGARIYVDLFPCNECAKEIIQAGISEVIYLSDKYAATDSVIASKMLFDECGVKYRQLKEEKEIVLKMSIKN